MEVGVCIVKWDKKRRSVEGMTLTETLVALFVFAIVMAGLSGAVLQVRQMSDRARDHYTAVNLAKSRIEQGRRHGYGDLSLVVETGTVVDKSGLPDSGGRYRRTTTVSWLGDNLAELTVQVKIKDRISLEFGDAQETVQTLVEDYMDRSEL